MSPTVPQEFLLGVNYPWVNYGQDFGRNPWGTGANGVSSPNIRASVSDDFERIRACGVTMVRWFLLCDGRSGLTTTNGIPTGPDDLLFSDVAAALELAQQFGLRVCFSLLDFLWMQSRGQDAAGLPNQDVLKFPAGRDGLLQTVLIPLFTQFRGHPALYAWEIANEPEWAISDFVSSPKAQMKLDDFFAFAREICDAIREYSQAQVTLGSARLRWVRSWSDLALDFYQAHFYPSTEGGQDADLAALLKVLNPQENLDQPLWLGELPAQTPATPSFTLAAALDTCKSAGLSGAGVWRWRLPEPGGGDQSYGSADPQFLRDWLTRNGIVRV